MECIRWGILGAGSIAHRFAAALERVEGAELVAISGRNAERLSAYAESIALTWASAMRVQAIMDGKRMSACCWMTTWTPCT